jgi:hypothetical protein
MLEQAIESEKAHGDSGKSGSGVDKMGRKGSTKPGARRLWQDHATSFIRCRWLMVPARITLIACSGFMTEGGASAESADQLAKQARTSAARARVLTRAVHRSAMQLVTRMSTTLAWTTTITIQTRRKDVRHGVVRACVRVRKQCASRFSALAQCE